MTRDVMTQTPARVGALPASLPFPWGQSVPLAEAGRVGRLATVVLGLVVHSGLEQRVPLLLSTALPRPLGVRQGSLLEAGLALSALYQAPSLGGCGYRGVLAPPGAGSSPTMFRPPKPLSTLAQGFGPSPGPGPGQSSSRHSCLC